MEIQGMQTDVVFNIVQEIALNGRRIMLVLAVLVVCLVVIKYLMGWLRRLLARLRLRPATVATVSHSLYAVLILLVVGAALRHIGVDVIIMRRLVFTATLVIVALIILFRPLVPPLPFKVGNTVKFGDFLGKVEATSFLNTRMRTFEGLTVWVPNSKIFKDMVINYHFTDTRRVKVDVGIRYDQDLLRAKQVLESVMIEDPRVLKTPRPVVYVLNLANSCVELGGRCWVENPVYWRTRCELIEKTKLRFDHEGIVIAFPQLDVHHHHETPPPASHEEMV